MQYERMSATKKGPSARDTIGAKALPCHLAGLLELVKLVVARVDGSRLPVGRVDRDRGQQIGRYDLDLVVVSFGVVDLRFAAGHDRVDHSRRDLGEIAGVLEDRRILLVVDDR